MRHFHCFAMLFVSAWQKNILYPFVPTPTWRCANGEALVEQLIILLVDQYTFNKRYVIPMFPLITYSCIKKFDFVPIFRNVDATGPIDYLGHSYLLGIGHNWTAQIKYKRQNNNDPPLLLSSRELF